MVLEGIYRGGQQPSQHQKITTEIEPLPSTKYMTTPRPQNDVWNEYLLTQWKAWKRRNKAN